MPSTSERQAMNAAIIDEFRANGGRVGGAYADIPLLLLTTRGARSGEARVSPAAYLADGDHFVIMAADGGRDTDPGWLHNLRADPAATIEVGTATIPVTATVATEPERAALADRFVAALPLFADFQARTTRPIPLVILSPAGADL